MEDFLDMTREFETKKKTLSDEAEYSGKINFRVPVAVRDTFQQVHGTSLRFAPVLAGLLQISSLLLLHVLI